MKLVRTTTLDNGFKVYTQSDDCNHLTGIGVRAGSLHDPYPYPHATHKYHANPMRGRSHATEHVIFRGRTDEEDRDIQRKLREYGCGPGKWINVVTSHAYTFYGTENLHRRKHSLWFFDTFAPIIADPVFRQDAIETELAAIDNEYRHLGEDSSEDYVFRLVHENMYQKNPARNRIDSVPEELGRITPQSMRRFYNAYYAANNMYAIIFGPRIDEATRMANKYFGHLEPRRVPRIAYDGSEQTVELPGVKTVKVEREGLHVYHAAVAFPTVPYKWSGPNGTRDKTDEALSILAEILEFHVEDELRGKNNDRSKGTYHPVVWNSRSYLHGLMYVWFETQNRGFVDEGTEKILRICEGIQKMGVSQYEIDAAIRKLELVDGHVLSDSERNSAARRMSMEMRREFREDIEMGRGANRNVLKDAYETTPRVLAEYIVEATSNGDVDMKWLNTRLQRLDAIKPEDVANVARRFLTTDRFLNVVLKPRGEIPATYSLPEYLKSVAV